MQDVLYELLNDLKKTYKKSDIQKFCSENNNEWFYSLLISSMEKNGSLILGFNWGASKDNKYKPQVEIVKTDFNNEDVGSLSRIFPYCRKYFDQEFLSSITQSNYCFFRSKNESQITLKDIELCEPIFLRLIEIIEPSHILCFSSKLRNFILQSDRVLSKDSKNIKFQRGKSIVTYKAVNATLKTGVEIQFLPHPNYPMNGNARNEAWKFCYGN